MRGHYDEIGAKLVRCGQDAFRNERSKRKLSVELMFDPHQLAVRYLLESLTSRQVTLRLKALNHFGRSWDDRNDMQQMQHRIHLGRKLRRMLYGRDGILVKVDRAKDRPIAVHYALASSLLMISGAIPVLPALLF
jgi:hypothetical protein